MKKLALTFLLILIAVSSLFASGKIIELDGNVTVQKAKTSKWIKATVNMELSNADKIRTLFSSSAIIKLADGSSITVSENTILDMASVSDKKAVNVKIVFGGLKADVMKKSLNDRSEFKVSTPTAVAGVRGTEFEARENAGKGAQFLVLDGLIEVESRGGKVSLEKGEKINIESNGDIGKKEAIKEGETLIVLTEDIKEKLKEVQKEIKVEEEKYFEEQKIETQADTASIEDTTVIEIIEDKKDTSAVEIKSDTTPVKSDTAPAKPRADLPPTASDTAVAAVSGVRPDTGSKTVDVDTVSAAFDVAKDTKPGVSVTPAIPASPAVPADTKAVPAIPAVPPKSVILPPVAPVISEPIDRMTIYTNRTNVIINSEANATVILRINNSEVSRQTTPSGEAAFSNITLREGANKISVIAQNSKGSSPEASVNINVITTIPAPQVISPASGQNFDRGPAPVINLASGDFLEWTRRNPLSIVGTISYKRQISVPEIKGRWVTAQNQPIEGDISAAVSVDGEEFEYTGRSDATGNFSISGITINLTDDKFVTKINNEEVNAVAGNFQYIWVMEQGNNKITIEAAEKTVNIAVKIRGRTGAGLESPIANLNYTSQGKNSMLVKEQKLDSLQPIIELNPNVVDNIVRITVRDPEPTSGVYKLTAEGFNFKRVEGSERDSEQVWEANFQLVRPNLPPPPPGAQGYRRQISLKIRATDKAENVSEKNEIITIFYD